jgi:hypothetical protein
VVPKRRGQGYDLLVQLAHERHEGKGGRSNIGCIRDEDMKKPKQALIIIALVAITLPLVTLFLPVPPNPTGGVEGYRAANISTTLIAVLHFGAAAMFVLGIDVFKERLQRAYRAICAAILVLGIAQLQFPVLSALDLWTSKWVTTYGLVSVPGLVASISLFVGVRSFALALKDTSWLTSPYLVGIALAAGVVAGLFLPIPYRAEAMGALATTVLGGVNAALVLRLKHITGAAYTSALAWFFLALAVTAVGALIPTVFDLVHAQRGAILALPAAVAGVLFIKAGWAFNKIRDY